MTESKELARAFEIIIESVIEESGLGTSRGTKPLNKTQLRTIERLHKYAASEDYKRHTGPMSSTSEIISFCDGFISDWNSSGIKSAAVQQLISLLNRPHIRGLLWSTEDVAAGRFLPELPSIPFEVDEDDGLAVKIVRIVRHDEPLGATIKCDHGKVYVARIMAGGVADRSGCIQEGDRVLEVNGESVVDKRADEIVAILNRCDGGNVTFKLVPVDVWNNHSSKSQNHCSNNNEKSNVHLRALFDYDGSKDNRHPCPEAALSFRHSDILELLVCNDEYWWQARRLGNGSLAKEYNKEKDKNDSHGSGKGVGLIPSELLQQKSKKFDESEEQKSGTMSRNSRSSKQKLNEPHPDDLFYETVCRWNNKLKIVRPIVLVGAPGVGRNEIKRRLQQLFPERFSTTVPHTSRQPRNGEVEGVDYYFAPRKFIEQMIENDEMLEFGEFRGNLYGTAISAVRVAREKATPLLTPHPLALRHLRTAEFAPIMIFIQPPAFHDFKETRDAFRARSTRAPSAASSTATSQTVNSSMGRGFSDAEIRQIIENSQAMDQHYGHWFDARITNSNIEDTMSEITKLIHYLETKPTWVPIDWVARPAE